MLKYFHPHSQKINTLSYLLLAICLFSCVPINADFDEKRWANFLETLNTRRDYSVIRNQSEIVYLSKALENKYNLVRLNAARDLSAMGQDASLAAPALARCIDDRNSKIAQLCFTTINSLGNIRLETSEILLKKIQSGRQITAERATSVICNSLKDQEIIEFQTPKLLSLLEDSRNYVRLAAAQSLTAIDAHKSRDETVREILRNSLSWTQGATKRRSLKLLVKLGENKFAAQYNRLKFEKKQFNSSKTNSKKIKQKKAKKKKSRVKEGKTKKSNTLDMHLIYRTAETALRELSARKLEKKEPKKISNWRSKLAYLKRKIEDGSPAEEEAAVRVLASFSKYLEEAAPILIQALSSSNSSVQNRAAKALGKMRWNSAVGGLTPLLDNPGTRVQAGKALQRIGTNEAQKAVREYIQSGQIKKLVDNYIASDGRPTIKALAARNVCYRILTRKLKGRILQDSVTQCVRETGAVY